MGKSRAGIPKHDDGTAATQAERDLLAAREDRLEQSARERSERFGHHASPDGETLSREGMTALIDREALREDNAMTTADDVSKIRTEWAGSRQPLRPGADMRQDEPAGNHPQTRADSELASGHMLSASVAGHGTPGLNYSVTEPRGEHRVQWNVQPASDAASPMHSALRQHVTGMALVSELDQAAASQPELRSQLGDRAPQGIAGVPGRGERTGTTSNQPGGQPGPAPRPAPGRHGGRDATGNDAIRAAVDRDFARPTHAVGDVAPPGYEFTARIPGSDPAMPPAPGARLSGRSQYEQDDPRPGGAPPSPESRVVTYQAPQHKVFDIADARRYTSRAPGESDDR